MINSLRTGLADRLPEGPGTISIRTIANGLLLAFPVGLRDMINLLEPVQVRFELNSGTCSGFCEITVTNTGTVHYTGKVHNSGALAAFYGTFTAFRLSPRDVLLEHMGHVGGTLSVDTRDSEWDMTALDCRPVVENWAKFKAGVPLRQTHFQIGTGANELIDAFANLATGFFVFSL